MIDLSRRRVLVGLIAAPLIVRTPGLLMPVKRFVDGFRERANAYLRSHPDSIIGELEYPPGTFTAFLAGEMIPISIPAAAIFGVRYYVPA
jgi:hypothetical protein